MTHNAAGGRLRLSLPLFFALCDKFHTLDQNAGRGALLRLSGPLDAEVAHYIVYTEPPRR